MIRRALFVIAISTPAYAQPQQEVLTLEKAIEIAVRVQPVLVQSRANIEAALGVSDQARVARRPTVTLVGGRRASGSAPLRPCAAPNAEHDSAGGGSSIPTTQTGLGVRRRSGGSMTSGRPRFAIRAAELSAEAVRYSLVSDTLGRSQRGRRSPTSKRVARQRLTSPSPTRPVKSEERHLDQARKFVAAQAKDFRVEVAQAQARAGCEVRAPRAAQSAQAIASLARLRAAIGWVDATRSPVVAGNWPTPPEQEPLQLGAARRQQARKQRSEVAQLDKQRSRPRSEPRRRVRFARPVLAADRVDAVGPRRASELDTASRPGAPASRCPGSCSTAGARRPTNASRMRTSSRRRRSATRCWS